MTNSENQASLRKRVLRAGGWSIAGYGLGQVLRFASNLIMTRLLVPEMFGIMAIATMVTLIILMLSDIGLSQNIVRHRRDDDAVFLDTVWVVQIARGVFVWLLVVLVSAAVHVANSYALFPAGSVYALPILPLVIAVNSFSAVILGLRSTKVAIAHRNFDQRRIVQIELISQIAALLVMIGAGVATRSVWAIVAGGLVAALVTTLLSHVYLNGRGDRFRWDQDTLKELFHFGKWMSVSSFATVLAVSGDRLLVGGFADAETLGLFAIAVLIIGVFQGVLGKLYGSVSLPALSETFRNDSARLREIYYKLRVPGDLLLLFTAGLLFMSGQLAIDILYDPRYAAAGEMLRVLALSLVSARYFTALPIYVSMGVPHYMAIINLVRCVSIYALVPLLFHFSGFQAALWGISLHALAMAPFIYGFNAKLGLNNLRLELAVLPALPAGLLCGWALNTLLAGFDFH